MEHTAKDLLELLNHHDECDWIEAKSGRESSRSVMETVCAYANEPGLKGGYILLGVAEDNTKSIPQYKTLDISDPDKFQKDFISQCSTMFNIPIRPRVFVEKINDDTVIKIHVDELSNHQKPLFFKSNGLPSGAYRRIGATDQRCTEDDMHIFYSDYQSYDQTVVTDSSVEDIDESALNRYRTLREKINPAAEELTYNDQELLESLGCLNRKNNIELTLAGLLLFGSSKALRRHFPMLRVDYIRVPGNEWVPSPDDRFTTIDMRGPLLTLLYRLMDAINSDLPKGFLLPENEVQAPPVGLPTKVLREAIVNALMHRSYREHSPIQVVRYDNRIEISNPGFSLKAEEKLGDPGSETRNPFIAAVFHETNLAETKGSGIRAMRKLMQNAHLVPPTFDSDRKNNKFTSRLLLHHFLDEIDLKWLAYFKEYNLNEAQKQALIFIREVGAIDNATYRQMSNCDIIQASIDLRKLKNDDLIHSKGKGKGTYYIPSDKLSASVEEIRTPAGEISTPVEEISTPVNDLSEPAQESSTLIGKENSQQMGLFSAIADKKHTEELADDTIIKQLVELKTREHNIFKVTNIIKEICKKRAVKASEIAKILGKGEDYIKRKYLAKMIEENELTYLYPEMKNHPQQAYKTKS